jgi:hypothetical protein
MLHPLSRQHSRREDPSRTRPSAFRRTRSATSRAPRPGKTLDLAVETTPR